MHNAGSTYGLDDIFSRVKNAGFTKPVYVLQEAYYGLKLKEIQKKLNDDINPNPNPEDFYFTDYIFKQDSAVFIGTVNDSIMNTLFN